MRRIVIVRHAKSDWSDESLADHERPLAPRGIDALARMRDHLGAGRPPDLVLCSSARRTVDTLDEIREAFPGDIEVLVDDALYGASSSMLVDRLRSLDDDVRGVLLVGHNPGVHDLALALAGSGDAETRTRMAAKFPTGAIATLSFESEWSDLAPGAASLDGYFTPRGGTL